ncbi:bacterial regulatory helix-turn-helix, lysR family protein [Burkholderia pseudomallei MSHR3960]|nr:bacterial regulatory helix-turn-helix, lysR family protein [Burkholderia pseudomallei MSHR3960]
MIDLRRLRYFIVVAEELHFGKAAQRLHLAQPPLTRHISALEGELGLRLFDRSTRSVKLTAEGELFLPHARDVLDAVHRAEIASQRAALGKEGKVALGYTSSVPLCDAFGTLIRNFARSFPDIELSLVEASSAQQGRSIKEGLLDIGIGWKNSFEDYEGCRVKTIAAEPLVVAVSQERALASEASLAVEQLADETFVLFPPGYGSTLDRKAFDLCATAGFTPRRGPSASQMTTMIALVAAGRRRDRARGRLDAAQAGRRVCAAHRRIRADRARADVARGGAVACGAFVRRMAQGACRAARRRHGRRGLKHARSCVETDVGHAASDIDRMPNAGPGPHWY